MSAIRMACPACLQEYMAGVVGRTPWPAHACPVEAALRELVRLKDGPRDDAYRATKDAAWDAARAALPRKLAKMDTEPTTGEDR